jgi:hypothetical protein
MKTIKWEKDGSGNNAVVAVPESARFISTSAATLIATGLMHEVSTISASFPEYGTSVFSRLAGVSAFSKKTGIFYGLYGCSDSSSRAIYCLRRCAWDFSFGSIDNVLQGLSAKTLFFKKEVLDTALRKLIESVDLSLGDQCEIVSRPTSYEDFLDKKICYFIVCETKDLSCKYLAAVNTNPFIENLFKELGLIYESLNEKNTVLPSLDTLRVSYYFQRFEAATDMWNET